jgi:hypothetical protein
MSTANGVCLLRQTANLFQLNQNIRPTQHQCQWPGGGGSGSLSVRVICLSGVSGGVVIIAFVIMPGVRS